MISVTLADRNNLIGCSQLSSVCLFSMTLAITNLIHLMEHAIQNMLKYY